MLKQFETVLSPNRSKPDISMDVYRGVLESMDQGFCIIEMLFDQCDRPIDYRFLEVNSAFENHTGLKSVVGKRVRELIPQNEQYWFDLYGKVALTGEPVRLVNETAQLDHRWFEVNAFRVGWPEERKVAIIFNDITERRRSEIALRNSEAQRFALIEHSPIGMYLVDSDFRLSLVNSKAGPVFRNIENHIGQDFVKVIRAIWPPQTAEEIVTRFRHTLKTGEPHFVTGFAEGRLDTGAQEYYDWEIHRVTLPDGRYGIVCYFIDISEHVLAKQRILEREALLRTVTDEARVGLVLVSPERRYLYANSAYLIMLRLPDAEIIGRSIADILGPVYDQVCPRLNRAFAGERVMYELRYPRDGEEQVYEVIYQPRIDAPQPCVVVVVVEITERKKTGAALFASERRLRLVADNAPMLIGYLDCNLVYQFGNALFLEWYGRYPTNVPLRELLGDEVFRHREPYLCGALEGERVHFEGPMCLPQIGLRHAEVTLVPEKSADGEVCGVFAFISDITERKRAEQALRRMRDELANKNLELEQRVQERTAKLRDTIGELEHFSYTITHDMRAPLRALQAFGQILREEYDSQLDNAGRDYLHRIVDSASRMDSLITDALNYSKVVQEEFTLESVDVDALLRGMIDSYPQFQPPQAEIRIEGILPLVKGNKAGLTQCFSNLLGNAVKFVEAGKSPIVRIWAVSRDEMMVRLWVEDNGIGIDPEQQQRVFVMFQRLSKQYEGTGIGLALVRKVVERMKGKVGFESEPGQGSRFWVEFHRAA